MRWNALRFSPSAVALVCLLLTQTALVHGRHKRASADRPLFSDLLRVGNLLNTRAFERATGYKYSLPEDVLEAAVHLAPRNGRLSRFLLKWLRGDAVKVGAVGGSLTQGNHASRIGVNDWFSLLVKFLQKAHPFARVTARNGGVPGTRSFYMLLCLEKHTDADTDLLLVDYAVNDNDWFGTPVSATASQGYEQLLRKALHMKNAPAVMAAMFFRASTQNPRTWAKRGALPFTHAIEDRYVAVANYYHLPWFSTRNAMFHLVQTRARGFEPSAWLYDNDVHPNDLGSRYFADVAVYSIQQALLRLARRMQPVGKHQRYALLDQPTPPVPPPMYPNNKHVPTLSCYADKDLQDALVIKAGGFEYKYEAVNRAWGPTKYGYIATKPAAAVRLRLWAAGDKVSRAVARHGGAVAYVGLLKSYKHMGRALVQCASGCTCATKVVDTHHTARVSQTYLTSLRVRPSARCEVQVTVLPYTSSGEHKVKVTTLVVLPAGANVLNDQGA